MIVTLVTFGSRGDAEPYVALGERLVAAGHQVRLVTHAIFEALAEGTGIEMYPTRGRNVSDLLQDPQVKELLDGIRNPLRLRDLIPLIEADLALLYEDAFAGAEGADVVVSSPSTLTGLPGMHAAERTGVPLVQAQLQPLTPTSDFAAPASPWAAGRDLGPILNRASYTLEEYVAAILTRGLANRCRRAVLGLGPKTIGAMRTQLRPTGGALLAMSPLVVKRPPDWPSHIRMTGWWWRSLAAPTGALPDDLGAFLAAGDAPILFSLGSMPVKNPAQVTDTVLAAASDAGVRLVLQRGWAGLGTPAHSADVAVVGDVSHDRLLPSVAAVVTHGGAGTAGRALRHGRPVMAMPSFSDQYFWGRRLSAIGAGPDPLPLTKLSRVSLAERFRALATERSYAEHSGELARRLADEDGCGNAVAALEEFCATRRAVYSASGWGAVSGSSSDAVSGLGSGAVSGPGVASGSDAAGS